MRIEGSSALVAGGASGLGAATARRLRAAGAEITIADLNAEKGAALAEELEARFVECDVTDAEQVAAAVEAAGTLRISVCCAGIGWAEKTAGRRGPHSFDPFEAVVRVNLIGTFNVLRLAAAAMLANEPDDGGRARGLHQHRLDRRLRRADRPARLLGLQGRDRRHDAPGRARPRAVGHPRRHHRARPVRHAAARRPARRRRATALGEQVPHPHRLGRPEEYGDLAAHIVENPMLNGEVIRLDGALRMPPR